MTVTTAFSLRRAGVADAACLSALAGYVFLDTYAIHGINAQLAREASWTASVDAFAARLTDAAAEVTVAEIGAKAVGFVDVLRGGDAIAPAACGPEVRRLYVHPRFQRGGIGAALLACAEHGAQASGAASLWLTAWVGNAPALAFYAALGWRDIGSTQCVFEGASHENRILVKSLSR